MPSASELNEVSNEATATCQSSPPMLARTVDVTNDVAVDAAVASVAEEMGGIDVLINNAGAGIPKGPLHEQSSKAFRDLLELNVVSLLSVSSAVLRHAMLVQGRGHIINISSRAGKVGLPGLGPYVASKFAVEGLTATLAAELGDSGILVNSISPGMVDTRSFPKAPGRPGVRTAESIRDGLLFVLESTVSGHYLHVDEFDEAVAAGKPQLALKRINEPIFAV